MLGNVGLLCTSVFLFCHVSLGCSATGARLGYVLYARIIVTARYQLCDMSDDGTA